MVDANNRSLSITADQINKSIGNMGGEVYHTQNNDELSQHFHYYGAERTDAQIAVGSNMSTGKGLTGSVFGSGSAYMWSIGAGVNMSGGSKSMNNLSPYTCVNFIIYTGVSS